MSLRYLALFAVIIIASGCHPTTPGNTNTAPPAGTPTTTCGLSANQTTNGLSMTCTVTGPLPNMRVDPLVAGNPQCGINSWTVSGQTVSTPLVAIYGQNGDDSNARVRLGVTLGPGTHAGSIAKDNTLDSCNSTVGPSFAISTTFAGNQISLVDKTRNPMCVFQSKLTLTSFTQTLTAGVPVNISGMTKQGTQDGLQKRIDLELAKAVNGLLNAQAPLPANFASTNGRCSDWQPFTGN